MTDLKDLSNLIAKQGKNPLILSSLNLQSQEEAALERKLRELKSKQELRKDWILFLVRDIVVFSAVVVFILGVSGYSLFTLIHR